MKKILVFLFLWLIPLTCFSFTELIIDEYKTDVYFGNGILTTDDDARSNAEDVLEPAIRKDIYGGNEDEMYKHIGKVDYAYNRTEGFIVDNLESLAQKLDGTFVSAVDRTNTIATIETLANLLTEEARKSDLRKQIEQYKDSIKEGHKVLVVAHSQGNLFAGEAYGKLGEESKNAWMQNYIEFVSIASPRYNDIKNGTPRINWDNDLVAYLSLLNNGWIDNPVRKIAWKPLRPEIGLSIRERRPEKRYTYKSQVGGLSPKEEWQSTENYLEYNGLSSILGGLDANVHAFTFYMGKELREDGKALIYNAHNENNTLSTNLARIKIMEAIGNKLEVLEQKPSQWKPKNLGCTCKTKYAKMTHKFDPALMDIRLEDEKVKDFMENEEGKIYSVDGQYVRALFGGETIEEVERDDVCYVLKDDASSELGSIEGLKQAPSTKPGVVEIKLTWDKPELDYDLVVEWDAGEVDVKDTGCPMEHFHIKSEMKIYPGTYRVSIVPKDPTDEGWKDPDLYPFTIDMETKTPGTPPDSMHFKVKNQSDINLGHVSDIKVFRTDDNSSENGSDDNKTDPNSGNGNGGSGGGQGGILIVPQKAPECPPVQHTPSPTPPKPIYFPYGGSGGWSFGACCGGGSGGGGSGGGGGGGGGGYSPPFTPQHAPECGGDTDCLPDPTDGNNNSNNPQTDTAPSLPFAPEVGGRPLPDKDDEEDNCTGNSSCGCIPCEYEIIPYKKQIYFGPLRDANFSIYSLDGYVNKESLFDGKTSNGKTLYDAGEIDVPQIFLNTLEDDKLYIIEAQGGEDIDRNDDFIIDSNATKNLGKVYAIASGKDIKYTGFKINILTTVTFELLKQSIEEGDTQEEIEQKITQIASRLLRYKVYPAQEDANISNVDLLAWLPTVDKELLLQSYAPLEEMVTDIYAGENIYDAAYKYVFYQPKEGNTTNGELPFDVPVVDESKPPIIRSFIKNISEDAEGGTLVGKIEILRGSEDVYFGELVGKGKEAFEVNDQGEVRLKEGVKLDYESKWLYVLQVQAFNKNGGSGYVAVYISVKNVLDAPEYEGYEGMLVDENISSGSVVGKLHFSHGAAPIESMELIGESKDMFTIDKNGTIRLADGKTLDYEQKYSYGFWAVAKNSYGTSMPVILHINIKDVADVPRITGYSGGYVHENAAAGTFVGQVKYDSGGAPIDTVSLEGSGSENFTIDLNGTIRVSDAAVLDYEQFTLYRPIVTVTNTYGNATRQIPISVVNTNDVPSFVSFVGGNVKENAPVGTIVGKITFDDGSMPIETITLSGEGSEYFRILSDGTIVVAKNGLNYEEKWHYIVKVIAANAVGESLPVTVHIVVDDVSETPAVLEDFVVNDVDENLSIGTDIGQITVLNEGSSAIELFEISGLGADKFSVDIDGNVSIAKALDFETQEIYNLHVKAKNGAGFGNEVNLIVRLSDVADIVPTLQGLSMNIEENATAGMLVGQANILSMGDRPITEYLLKGDGSEKFDVNASGAIHIKENGLFDYETQMYYYLTLSAGNEAGESTPVGVTVNILNSPDIVPVLEEGVLRIDENSPEGTIVGQIRIVTSGDSPIDTFEINGEGSDNFIIDENGTVKVSNNANLDYENTTHYTLQIKVHSAAGYSNEVSYVIWVDNVPDMLPVLSYAPITSIDENQTKSIAIGKVSVTQSDTPVTSMTLSGVGSDKFTIDSNGTLYTKENTGFDYESEPSYTIYVLATSAAGNSEPLKVTIPIGNVEENPKLSTLSASIDENATAGQVVGQVNIIGHGDSPIVSMILSGNGSNNFTIDVNGTIKVSDTAKLDYETTSSYAFKAVATNRNGHSSSYAYNEFVRISLNNIPDEPVLELNGTYSVDENATEGTVVGKINIVRDGDSKISHFEFPYSYYRNGINIDNEGIVTVGADTTLDYETRNSFGFYAVAVNENGNKSNQLYITVSINNIPDEPILKPNQQFSVDENASIGTVVGKVAILDEGDTPIESYEIVYDYSNGILDVDANGTIVVKDSANLDYENRQYLSLYVRARNESGKYSKRVNVSVNVNNIPDEPVVQDSTFSIEENATAGTIVGELNITSTGDSPIALIEYSDYQNNFTIDNNGTIRVSDNANLDYEQQKSHYLNDIKVTNETGNTIYTNVTIDLINIPDEPVLGAVTCSVEEHKPVGTKVCQLGIVEEGDSPIVSIDFVDYNGVPVETPFSIDKNGTIFVQDSGRLDYENKRYYELFAVATNQNGKKSYRDEYYADGYVYIGIENDPYDAPILERKTIYIDENSSVGTVLGNVLTNEGKAEISEAIAYKSRYTTYGNPTSIEVSKLFSVDLDGNIIIKAPLDYEKNFKPCQNVANSKRYCEYINVKMTNQYGSTILYKQEIEIGNVPDNPPVLKNMVFEIAENAPIGTVVGHMMAVEDGEGPVTHFDVNNSTYFTIDNNGTITVAKPLDYETQDEYVLNVTASNAYATSDAVNVSVHVTDIADVVPVLHNFTGAIDENATNGMKIGMVQIENSGDSAIETMILNGNGNENFTIASDGTIRVATGAALDFETQKEYPLNAVATNQAGNSNPVDINITLNDIHKIGLMDFTGAVDENSPAETVVGKIAMDISEDRAENVVLTGEGNEHFKIDTNGTITVSADKLIDYEKKAYYTLKAVARNSFVESNEVDVNISVNNLAETPPKIAYFYGDVKENSEAGIRVGKIDIQSDTGVTNVTLSGTGNENFVIDSNGTVEVADGADLDYEKQSYYYLTVHAANSFGMSTKQITIYVVNVPDTPPNVSVYDMLIVEDRQDSSRDVGNIYNVYVWSDSSVDNVRLEGTYANDFTINNQGKISIADGVTIDINRTKQYHLTIIAENTFGESAPKDVTIDVHYSDYISFDTAALEMNAQDMAKDSKNNSYIVGTIDKPGGHTSYTIPIIAKYDSSGTLLWAKEYNITVDPNAWYAGVGKTKVYVDNADNIYISGNILGDLNNADKVQENLGGQDLYCISLDANSTTLWMKQFGSSVNDEFIHLLTKNNKVYIAANMTDEIQDIDQNAITDSHGSVYVFDTNGTLDFVKQFESSKIDYIKLFAMRYDNVGFSISSILDQSLNSIKTTEDLTVQEIYQLSAETAEQSLISEDEMGNIYTLNSIVSMEEGADTQLVIKKYTLDGTLLWTKSYTDDIQPERIYFSSTGFKITGSSGNTGRILEFDLTGNLLQNKNYGLGENKLQLFILDNIIYLIEKPRNRDEEM